MIAADTLPPAIADRLPAWLQAPYLSGGRDPAGWDCWGCVVHVAREAFGQTHGPLAGLYVDAVEERARIRALVGEALPCYRALAEPAPGAVALMSVEGDLVHAGLMLTPRLMISAIAKAGTITALVRRSREGHWLAERAPRHIVGFFVLAGAGV